MSPGLTVDDTRDVAFVDIESCYQQSIADTLSMQLAYEKHILGSELGEPMALSGWSPRTALDSAISDILSLGTEEPMIGSLTRRVVTAMQDRESIGDGTDQVLVSPAVDSYGFPIHGEGPIAIASPTSGPRPASIGIRTIDPGEIPLQRRRIQHHFKRYQRGVR
jgi:hypothetical protein